MILGPSDEVPARLAAALQGGPVGRPEIERICGGRRAALMELGRLKSLGYEIEGGRAVSAPDLPLPWLVSEGRRPGSVGSAAEYFDVCASTQDEAARMGTDGAAVFASRQTRGRGRSGRAWESPEGGLWMSAFSVSHVSRARCPSLIPAAASLAVHDAVSMLGAEPSLRWPNDVELGGKKLAGVAVEASLGDEPSAVIGIGLNFDVDAPALEARLSGTPGFRGAASLADSAPSATMVGAARLICDRLEARLSELASGERTVSDWTSASSTIGSRVRAGSVEGTAVRMDGDGSLVIEAGGEVSVSAGDVERLS